MNTMRYENSPTQKYHQEKYGQGASYVDTFVPIFNEQIKKWNPTYWAKIFKSVHASYVVLTTKHHDGYTLWPSNLENPHRTSAQSSLERDIVGELSHAVWSNEIVMGLYYSGGRDWSFDYNIDPDKLTPGVPQSEEYAIYAKQHIYELLNKYKPCILWNDMGYPRFEKEETLHTIFAELFNKVCPGASVTNNRWGMHSNARITRFEGDFKTPEYTHLEEVTEEPWEMNRGLGYSFGYNQNEGERETISIGNLTRLFIDVVSKNGNMLLDLAPLADGSFSDIQTSRLDGLAKFMNVYAPTIQFTRPFLSVGSKPAGNYRILKSREEDKIFVFIMNPKKQLENNNSNPVLSSIFILPITSRDREIKYDLSLLFHDGMMVKIFDSEEITEGIKVNLKNLLITHPLVEDWPLCVILHNFSQKANLAFSALAGATEGEMVEQKRDD